jgi:hypothetical protein
MTSQPLTVEEIEHLQEYAEFFVRSAPLIHGPVYHRAKMILRALEEIKKFRSAIVTEVKQAG